MFVIEVEEHCGSEPLAFMLHAFSHAGCGRIEARLAEESNQLAMACRRCGQAVVLGAEGVATVIEAAADTDVHTVLAGAGPNGQDLTVVSAAPRAGVMDRGRWTAWDRPDRHRGLPG